MNFYTSVHVIGNNVMFRGIRNGKRVKQRIEYSPSLYLETKKDSKYKSLQGLNLEQKKFETIRNARDFMDGWRDVSNAPKIYGQARFEYAYITDHYTGLIDYDFEHVRVAVIDIEVGSENGFPDPYEATEPITAICIQWINGKTYVFGCGDYKTKGDEIYVKCKDEYELCKKFVMLWAEDPPDILSGWYMKDFDVPYLVNRFRRIVGDDFAKQLSPWNIIKERKTINNGKQVLYYELLGVSCLDYIDLYKWYAPNGKSQENYRLETIAQVELGEGKLSYDEYDNLHTLYRLDYQKFIEDNIKDVGVVMRLEEKLKLLELAISLTYDTKSNYDDVFAQTRMWDALTYSYLKEKDIIVPPRIVQDKDMAFEGAYVKEPQVGFHEYVVSFDLNSLYPHLMMQYNISPETLIEPEEYDDEMRAVISQNINVDKLLSKSINMSALPNDVVLTPNGQFFRKNIRGFLPQMLEEMYEDRKKFKKLYLQAKQELENEKDVSKQYEIEKKIARYNNLQLAKKVGLNSAYGALGSQYFRFFDLRLALAVTTAGQLSIRWIQDKINDYMNKLLKTETDYVIASDTDSIYLRLGDLVKKVYGVDGEVSLPKTKIIDFMDKVCRDKLEPYIDKSYKELGDYMQVFAQKMQMKRESLADKGMWTAKKRYILNVYDNEGVRYNEPDLKIMGLEVIKSSTPSAIRVKMKEMIALIMKGTEKDIQKFIKEFKKEFKAMPAEEISFPRGVNGIRNYSNSGSQLYIKGTPIHVKGAILYNHYLKEMKLTKKYELIKEGEKIKFTYLKEPNPFKNSVISFPSRIPAEFGLDKYIDYELQFEKTFLGPMQTILDCVGWRAEKLNTLEGFFK